MHVGTSPAASGLNPVTYESEHLRVTRVVEGGIGSRASNERSELDLGYPLVTTGSALGDDLLSEDVERSDRRVDEIEAAVAHRTEERDALDEFVRATSRRLRPFGRPSRRCSARPTTLQERRDRTRGSELTDEIDRSDVDTELE